MRRSLLAAALAVAACGSGAADDDAPVADAAIGADARVVALDGPCPQESRVGAFEIRHTESVSLVGGVVRDAVEPATILTLEHEEGGCRFLRKINPFCDPPCQASETCNLANACVARPRSQNVGTVTVTGLGQAVAMEPNAVNSYQDATLPSPPFAAGDTIVLSAAGGDVPGFTLDAVGVTPLEVAQRVWTMKRGEPMTIAWTAADGAGKIHVSLNVDLHGNSPVTMFCTFEDTGTAVVPASLVDRLIDFGVTPGFASATISRRTIDSVQTSDGCVQLDAASELDPMFALEEDE